MDYPFPWSFLTSNVRTTTVALVDSVSPPLDALLAQSVLQIAAKQNMKELVPGNQWNVLL